MAVAVDAVGEKSNGGKRQRQQKKPIAAGVAGGCAAEDNSAEGGIAAAAVAAAVGAVERGAVGAAGVKRKRACGLCKGEGHTRGRCPQKEFAKPETPNADLVVEEGMAVGVFDVENSGAVINEIGLVGARFSEGQWVDLAAENGDGRSDNGRKWSYSASSPGRRKSRARMASAGSSY